MLAFEPESSHDTPTVVVLTGPSRAGKTTVCRAVIDEARNRDLVVAGVLTEDDATPEGFRTQRAVDLRRGRSRLLATVRRASIAEGSDTHDRTLPSGIPRVGWDFNEVGVAFGRAVLQDSLRRHCDLLVIDQLGPLEFLEQRGWTVALDVLDHRRFRLALVVINPRVLAEARLRIAGCTVVEVNDVGRDDLPAAICAAHLPPRPSRAV